MWLNWFEVLVLGDFLSFSFFRKERDYFAYTCKSQFNQVIRGGTQTGQERGGMS